MNAAHNDFLQVLAETGAIGFGLVVWFLIIVYRKGMQNLYCLGELQPATLAALIAIAGLMVHSFFDFNLHIPANASLFDVLCSTASGPSAAHNRVRVRTLTQQMDR